MTAWAGVEDVPSSCSWHAVVTSSAGPKCWEHWTGRGISHSELDTGSYDAWLAARIYYSWLHFRMRNMAPNMFGGFVNDIAYSGGLITSSLRKPY